MLRFGFALAVFASGCVQAPELAFDNPCDPASTPSGADCPSTPDMALPVDAAAEPVAPTERDDWGHAACGIVLDCVDHCLAMGDDPGDCNETCRAGGDGEARYLFDWWLRCLDISGCEPGDCEACEGPEADCRADAPCPAPMADTDVLPAVAVSGGLGPVSRIASLALPGSNDEATALGCGDMVGANRGTGLTGLATLAMVELDALVQPDEDGRRAAVLLLALDGWAAGQTADDLAFAALDLYLGAQADDGTITVDPVSLDGVQAPIARFPAARTTCGALLTDPASFTLSLGPIFGLAVDLPLTSAVMGAELGVDAAGFTTSGGTLQGYLSRAGLIELVADVKAGCAEEKEPSGFCQQVSSLLAGDDVAGLVDQVVAPYLGGFDARIEPDGAAVGCGGQGEGECDAMSVCFAFDGVGQVVAGGD